MKLKHRLGFWPPYAVPSSAHGGDIQPGLSDIVISAERQHGAIECIIITLKKPGGSECRSLLNIGPHLLDHAIRMIEQKPKMTLHELGNLDI